MLIHFFITLLILSFIVRLILRMIFRPFRQDRYYGGYDGYGYNPYRYGCRRRHRLLGGLLPIVALVALDRFFTRRF